jgi:uncharacterized protein
MSSDPEPRLIYAPDQSPQPWRNGGGQTRELLRWPEDTDNWRLRVSLARIDRSGPFSAFPAVERWFVVLDGAGVTLRIDSQVLKLDAQSAPLCFDGGNPPDCSLMDGPTNDLNLMCRGGRGTLLGVSSGVAWLSSAPQRGLFTRLAGIWRNERGQRIELEADTLLWSASNNGAMVFDARSSAKGPAGYWLAYHPEDG